MQEQRKLDLSNVNQKLEYILMGCYQWEFKEKLLPLLAQRSNILNII